MGIRYVIVPERLAPSPFSTDPIPVPARLTSTLAGQLDLEPLDVPAGLTVYRNQAALPPRAELPSSVEVPTGGGVAAVLPLDLSGATSVLPDEEGRLHWSGELAGDSTFLLAASSSDRWELEVDGESIDQIKPFGWATGFEVADGGDATLRFRTPPLRYVVLVMQAIVWLWLLRVLVRRRFEANGDPDDDRRPPPDPEHVPAHRAPAHAAGVEPAPAEAAE
jgi:hypothetical protein